MAAWGKCCHDNFLFAPLSLARLSSTIKWRFVAATATTMKVSEYEKERLRRIQENEEALKLIFGTKEPAKELEREIKSIQNQFSPNSGISTNTSTNNDDLGYQNASPRTPNRRIYCCAKDVDRIQAIEVKRNATSAIVKDKAHDGRRYQLRKRAPFVPTRFVLAYVELPVFVPLRRSSRSSRPPKWIGDFKSNSRRRNYNLRHADTMRKLRSR